VRRVWSRLWSPQVQNGDLKTAKTVRFASRVHVAMTNSSPPVFAGDEDLLGRFGYLSSRGPRFRWPVDSSELETMIDGVRLSTPLLDAFTSTNAPSLPADADGILSGCG
jgi:hypothetical protein